MPFSNHLKIRKFFFASVHSARTRLLCVTALLLAVSGSAIYWVVRADNTAQTLPFTQNWTTTTLITANDNWSGVPGIEGFLGQDITTVTGTDPQTLVGVSGVANDLDVIANQTNPNITNGGVAEFDGIANPTIALQGSGTADAPYVLIHLNTTGQTNINVAYNLRDLDATTDNSVQPVALQYRVGNSGNFTNLAAGFVADATTGPSLATLVTPVSVTLPAAANNQSLVQVRIMTTNAAGNDEWVGIDDISITASGGPDAAPSVSSTVPTNAATGVAANTNITINFSEAVNVTGSWFTISGSVSGANTASVSGGPTSFTLDPGTDFTAGETVTVTIVATQVTDQDANDPPDTMAANHVFTFTIAAPVTLTKINAIQGSGAASPLVGNSVTTQGIVTGLKSNGFFLQEPDASVDANPLTSEGIFVFTSSAPPVAATIGNLVQVTATVVEFVPSADPQQPPLTELSSPTVTQLSSGNSLPATIPLTATFPDPTGAFDQLERVEGMRVSVSSLTVCGPTLGNVNEPNATATSTGVFFGTVTGVTRPFREAGIQQPDVPPSGTIPPIPRFDTNPEAIRVDSDGQTGGTAINVSTTAVVSNLIGPLDYGFRHYTILPDPSSPLVVSGGMAPTAVPTALSDEVTIASYNIERFFDDVNDPLIGEPVLTTSAYQGRLAKASLHIRDYLKTPDIVGIVEIENLTTLQALATKINNDAVANSQPNPLYVAYLIEGNDVGGIDVGFLVKTAIVTGSTPRVTVNGGVAIQELDASLFTNADSSTETLHDRPPLRLDATVNFANGATFPVQVIINHLRSLNGVDDAGAGSSGWATVGARVRAKRLAQVVDLANLVQTRQTNNPNERIILLGDFNFFEVNDGYGDSMSTLLGAPVPDNETVVPGDGVDLVNPNLTLLLDALLQRYSFVFDGNAQSLDHAIINAALIAATSARRVEHPRVNGDFPETDRNGALTRLADHDPLVVYLKLQACTVTCPNNITTVAAAGQCSANVTFSPTLGGTCGTVTCSPASGTAFSVGTTTVTCSQTGGTPTCSFTVTVTDNQAPTLGACPGNITNQSAGANCTAVVTFTPPTASDNCGATVTCTPASGSSFALGTTTVSCVAKDAANNMSQPCTFTVQVVDTTSPTLGACPSNITNQSAGANCTAVVTFTPPTASDNCGATVTCTPTSGSNFPLGVTTVTCTARDAANNSSSCSFTVTVNDTTMPTISCPGNQTAGSSGGAVTVNYPAPTAMDNCTATPTVTCNPISGASFPVGVTTVSCTARDAANNQSQACSFTVTVIVNQFTPTPTVRLTDPLICTGPGNAVSGTFAVTNTSQVSQTGTITVALPAGLVGLPNTCSANVGSCTVSANSVVWNGTLAAGQTITATYQAQVGDQVLNGTQLCAQTTAVFGQSTATVPACLTVNCPGIGPGSLPQGNSPLSDQKAGSVLIYNVYTSSTDPTKQNTRINLTNVHPSRLAQVHLYFVAEGCSVADSYVCLTPNQTTSFLMSDLDPGTTGYIVAVATNQMGCPINFNYLIGDEYVKFSSGHAANLAAISVSAIAGGLTACNENTVIASLNFDGVSYGLLPRTLAVSNVGSKADGNDTMLILNRIGGNLGIGASTLGTIFGIFYDDAENAVSFTVNGSCQLRGSLSNNFPRTTPRFEQFVPAGRTGWLKLYRQEADIAMTGATINFNPNSTSSIGAFNQGHNMHVLTLSGAASYIVPVFPPPGC